MERLGKSKQSSLIQKVVNYGLKKFYTRNGIHLITSDELKVIILTGGPYHETVQVFLSEVCAVKAHLL